MNNMKEIVEIKTMIDELVAQKEALEDSIDVESNAIEAIESEIMELYAELAEDFDYIEPDIAD